MKSQNASFLAVVLCVGHGLKYSVNHGEDETWADVSHGIPRACHDDRETAGPIQLWMAHEDLDMCRPGEVTL